MADIELLGIQSGYNFNRINYNFDKIQDAINDAILHRSGNNNVMGQTLDMDSHRLIHLIEPFSRHEPATKGYVDDIALGGAVPVVMPVNIYSIIDMNSDDYTMTDEEAYSVIKFILNGASGKILTYPSTSDEFVPPRQVLINFSGEAGVIIASESGGDTAVMKTSPDTCDIAYVPGSGIFVVNSNLVLSKIITDTTYTLLTPDIGAILVFTSNTPVTLTVPAALVTPGVNFTIVQGGDGQVTLSGDATLIGEKGTYGTNGKNSVIYLDTTDASIDKMIVTGSVGYTQTGLASASGVLNINLNTSKEHFTLGLTENVTSITFSNLPAEVNCTKIIKIVQDATTPYTVAFPASFKWAGGAEGTVSSTLSAEDLLAITTFDGGTSWYATLTNGFE